MPTVRIKKTRKAKYDSNGVSEEEIVDVHKLKSRQFFIAFRDEVQRLFDLTGNELKLFIKMASEMDHENRVRISEYDRKEWASEMSMTPHSFNMTISRLVNNRGVVLREGLGAFRIDPEVFNNGDIKEVPEKISQYDVHYTVEIIENPKTGIKKKIKHLRITPGKPVIDLETGEVKYKRRGRPCKKPNPEDVSDLYSVDDSVDIGPETGEVLNAETS